MARPRKEPTSQIRVPRSLLPQIHALIAAHEPEAAPAREETRVVTRTQAAEPPVALCAECLAPAGRARGRGHRASCSRFALA